MSIFVLVEPLADGTGYRASTGAPLDVTATGATPEAALGAVGRRVAERWERGARLYPLPTVAAPPRTDPPRTDPPPTDEEVRNFWASIEEVRRLYEERDQQWTGVPDAPPAA